MNSFPIPVRMVGAGSHVEEEQMQYLDMPRDMRTFEMPRVPERVDPRALTSARNTLARFLACMNGWQPGTGPNPRLDMRGIDSAALKITNEMLGDGEVSIQVNGNRPLRIKSRAPSFIACQALPKMIIGGLIADVIAVIGSTDVVMGDVDR